jgi:hypothetical protein
MRGLIGPPCQTIISSSFTGRSVRWDARSDRVLLSRQSFSAALQVALRIADHPPTIAGTAAHRGNPNCYKWNLPVVSARLRDDDQPVGACVAFPGSLDLGERNTLGLDAQCATSYAVYHLLERVGEYVPRRHASGS